MSAATKAIFDIDNLDDLREAQNALNARFRELQLRAAHSFRIGEKVTFKTRTGEIVTGVIKKINQKTVSVQTATTNWKVSASLLKKA